METPFFYRPDPLKEYEGDLTDLQRSLERIHMTRDVDFLEDLLQGCLGTTLPAVIGQVLQNRSPRELEQQLDPLVIVDLGCGSGTTLECLLQRYPQTVIPLTRDAVRGIGVDLKPVPGLIPQALLGKGKVPMAQLIQGSGEALPLADETVDVLYSLSTLIYIVDVLRVLEETYRVLRPGGQAFLEIQYNAISVDPAFDDIVAQTAGAQEVFCFLQDPRYRQGGVVRVQKPKDPQAHPFAGRFPFRVKAALHNDAYQAGDTTDRRYYHRSALYERIDE